MYIEYVYYIQGLYASTRLDTCTCICLQTISTGMICHVFIPADYWHIWL